MHPLAATPADHARAIISWWGKRPLAAVEHDLATVRDGDPLLMATDAIADAADSGDEVLRGAGLSALFGGLVEPLNDSFSPSGRALYARLFGRMVWHVASRDAELSKALAEFDITSEATLLARHAAVRRATAAVSSDVVPTRIVILSRVTIGADILLTSVAVQRLHQRFPQAELILLGDGKMAGLFGGLPRLRVRPLTYARRGPLRERLASWLGVVQAVREENPDLVLAPDSRLDQLGVLPVMVDASRYMLWENVQPEQTAPISLADLIDRWLVQRLGLPPTPALTPRVGLDSAASMQAKHLRSAFGPAPLAAVKLDHGGNPAKSLPREAETLILRHLRNCGWRVLIDRGFGAEELANSDGLLKELQWQAYDLDDSGKNSADGAPLGQAITNLQPGQLADVSVIRFHGSIAGWAAALSCCGLAISYDSVGHHLAAALAVPVITAFTGHGDAAFAVAWQPRGLAQVTVIEIPTDARDRAEQWQRVAAAIPHAR